MAKGNPSDSIMGADKLKPLLSFSKQEPVQAAIALTADGDGLILLDKKKKPRAVMALLKASAAKAKLQLQPSTLRFGRAVVDPEYDGSMVRFFINKEAPGNMRARLVEVVKRSAYQKVEFNVDPALESEPEEDADAPEEAPEEAPEDAPAAASAPQPDPAALIAQLSELVRRIAAEAAADPALKAKLLGLANQANTAIKAADLEVGVAAIAQLREGLETGGANNGPTKPADDALAKLRLTFDKLAPALALAAQATPVIAPAIDENTAAFQAAIAAGDAVTARDYIFELASLAKPRGAAEAAATIPSGIVETTKFALEAARKRWDLAHADARADAAEVLAELQSAYPAQAAAFEQILDTHWRGLADAIADAEKRDPAAGFKDLRDRADQLRTDMMGDAVLDYLERQGVAVRAAFMSGLDSLESNIRT